jgi:hypothetical protein
VCALLGLAVPVVAFAAARQLSQVSLLQATIATCGSGVLGLAAIVLTRRARRNVDRTLGRAGGLGAARAGRILGVLALCIGCAAGVALAVYALLRYFP